MFDFLYIVVYVGLYLLGNRWAIVVYLYLKLNQNNNNKKFNLYKYLLFLIQNHEKNTVCRLPTVTRLHF